MDEKDKLNSKMPAQLESPLASIRSDLMLCIGFILGFTCLVALLDALVIHGVLSSSPSSLLYFGLCLCLPLPIVCLCVAIVVQLFRKKLRDPVAKLILLLIVLIGSFFLFHGRIYARWLACRSYVLMGSVESKELSLKAKASVAGKPSFAKSFYLEWGNTHELVYIRDSQIKAYVDACNAKMGEDLVSVEDHICPNWWLVVHSMP